MKYGRSQSSLCFSKIWPKYLPIPIFFSSHIPSRHEREVSEFRKLEREKSFDEARTAVQSQIEKIFMKTAATNAARNGKIAPGQKKQTVGALTATNQARLSRRDQEQDGKVKKHPSSSSVAANGASKTSQVTSTLSHHSNIITSRKKGSTTDLKKVKKTENIFTSFFSM